MVLRKTSLLVAAVAIYASFSVNDARAYDVWGIIMYDISFATGATRDFISDPGYIGISVEGRSFDKNHVSTGFVIGWQNLYEKTDEIIQLDNVTISGTQVRYLDFLPILWGVNYHFGDRSCRLRPYLGAKVGTYYVSQRVDIGTVEIIVNRNWHLGVSPEAGFTFLTPTTDFYGFLSADYNYVFSRDDTIDYSYAGLSIGFVYVF
ncbi:MAG: hypothetical protein KAJ37_05570 [Candidatus Krumholzibacteria bacterium]|nr:hypothetical protein [Candidatus Krumholzibacteria bacterium]